ncbi:Outer membrane protein assembly factor BamB precursor [Rubripirellula amarantea]|uniref:Outer membrane protein assembly factor BamB n=1 Tax=Rubripirellula amarantea TaxID=2527999 RepID=A0A5C5WF07_9BACT|nr:PQQ-binding-like beta-propeller repeat protein [Rubripirellula amarantea]TWT49368.1 Outer membrane protein assembly factor BamB precursor [Rubripirellula amarantea]
MNRVPVLALISLALFSVCHAEPWPQFRGPHGNGIAAHSVLPAKLDQSTVKWETAIPGKGWSSPVVWDKLIWLTTAAEDGTTMSVIAVDRSTGKVVRDILLLENEEPRFCHPTNSYASCTPVVTSDRVYVHFGSYLTACLDSTTGKELWRRTDVECDHFRGPASSPILHDGKLIVAFDGVDQQFVVAFDAETGETVWQTDRQIDYGTDEGDWMKAYGTAHAITINGQPQVISPSASAAIAYEPKSGRPLWSIQYGGMNASARPIYSDGLLFLINGMGNMVAAQPGEDGLFSGDRIAWSAKTAVAKKASPIIHNGILYMNSDDGIISARTAATGEILWRKRVGREFAASPVMAGQYIYFFGGGGDIITIKPGSNEEPIAQTNLGDGFMASPAVVDNEIILRSRTKLYCLTQLD